MMSGNKKNARDIKHIKPKTFTIKNSNLGNHQCGRSRASHCEKELYRREWQNLKSFDDNDKSCIHQALDAIFY